jgi:hypothetical protein
MQLPRRTTLKVLISVIGALSSCQLARAQAVPVDTSTIPTLLTKVGPVQIGIRYKLSGTQTEKDVTVNTQDYKNSTTISGSSETSSTTTLTNKLASKFDGNFGIAYPGGIKLSLGGGITQTSDDDINKVFEDKSKLDVIDQMSDDVNSVLTSTDFQQASFDPDSGFFYSSLSFYNYSTQTITLKNISVAITGSSLLGPEQSLATGVLGLQTVAVPGASLAASPQATQIDIPPFSSTNAPYQQTIYFEGLPTDTVKGLISQRSAYHLQFQSAEYSDSSGNSIDLPGLVANLTTNNIGVQLVLPGSDQMKYFKPTTAAGKAIAIRDVILAIDPNAVISVNGAQTSLQNFLGKETKFNSWDREKPDPTFLSADANDGAWMVSITPASAPTSQNAQWTVDTSLQKGDQVQIVYLLKSDIIANAVDELYTGGVSGSGCAIDPKGAIAPGLADAPPSSQLCFAQVLPGDLLRVEGRGWRAATSVSPLDTPTTAARFPAGLLRDTLTAANATLSVLSGTSVPITTSDIGSSWSLNVGGGPDQNFSDLIFTGQVSIEFYADGWFAIDYLAPPTFASNPVWVCMKDTVPATKLQFGRSLNWAISSLDTSCPSSGCDQVQQTALQWKTQNAVSDHQVYDARKYTILTRHFQQVTSLSQYISPVAPVSPDSIKKLEASDTQPTPNNKIPPTENACVDFSPAVPVPANP